MFLVHTHKIKMTNMKQVQLLASVVIIAILVSLHSCASYKLQYTDEAAKWQEKSPDTAAELDHSIYLIGDTGNAKEGETIPLFPFLKQELIQASENSSIIFLGDNIYPVGMPPKTDETRPLAEHKLNTQIDMVKDFKGKIMFIPGNHDWTRYQTKGLKRQEKYIEKSLNRHRNGTDDKDDKAWENHFFPSGGCGDPKVIEVNERLVVILIDSQWWLQNWNADQSINEGCEIKTRAGFYRVFENLVRKYKSRNVVIAAHHPIVSNGQHGGNYTFQEHIFPLRFVNKKLNIPLPGVGSAVAFARASIGVPQDLANAQYRGYIDDVLAAMSKNGQYIYASGHEHTLQYSEKRGQHLIVSGSGSKENAASLGKRGEFSYGRLGYSKLDFYKDGTTWVSFHALSDDKTRVEEVFRKKIKGKLPISKDNIPDSFDEYDKKQSVVTRHPTNFNLRKTGGLYNGLFGTHYKDLYSKEYPFQVLDLNTFKGGITPIKRGGGNQTNSLRLAGADGHQYTMRSLTKDASRALPYPFNKIKPAQNIILDNFMAAHPFAALAVKDMAEAANIYHTNPELYYIPKQPALDVHNDVYGEDVYLVEERPAGNWEGSNKFGNSKNIISTLDLIEKIKKNRKHRVDQNWAIRSRLFDLIIKDWDRHEDQWRWASFKDGDTKIYRPIPRDRDQAFARYDGFLAKTAYLTNPFTRQLQTFRPDVKNIKWESWNSTYFDQTFLGELDWEDWKKEAEFLRDNITDEVIETAFSKMPKGAHNEAWKQMIEDTKARRNQIVEFAERSYKLKSKQVDILGTSHKDLFVVERIDENHTKCTVYELNKRGEKKGMVYERVFNHSVTKEIHLYGLEDDDKFEITGDVKKSLKIRVIGGLDNDEVIESSRVRQAGKKTLVYDSDAEKNRFVLGKQGTDKSSNKTYKNTYDRRSRHYDPNFWLPLPVIEFNPDDGLILGASATFYNYKFKKKPYGEKHAFGVNYSTSTQALDFRYNSEFIEVLGSWDLLINSELRRNRFAFNYYGFGNNTINPDPDELDFNRVRQSKIYADLLIQKRFSVDNGRFAFGPLIERTRIDDTPDRFIVTPEALLPDDVFEERIYAGIRAEFTYENLDSKTDPHRGIKFEAHYNLETLLDDNDFTFGRLGVGLKYYKALDKRERFVLATQAKYEQIDGDFDFWKAPSIGGLNNLRGFRINRFRGTKSFYHTTDLRIKLFNVENNTLPFNFGIHGGFEYGRVFTDDSGERTDDDMLHTAYGGGLWLDPVDFIVISFGIYESEEDSRFIFKLNHMF